MNLHINGFSQNPEQELRDAQRMAAADRENAEWAVQPNWLRANSPPPSYAAAPFFSVNSFVFQNAAGEKRHVRWTFEPVAGRSVLTPEERAARGADFLQDELRARVATPRGEITLLLGRDFLLDAELAARIEALHGVETVELKTSETRLALVG